MGFPPHFQWFKMADVDTLIIGDGITDGNCNDRKNQFLTRKQEDFHQWEWDNP